jgi:NAD(P)-dependent dehydrogenase (short-subunit alcohol dehydrogenase family)
MTELQQRVLNAIDLLEELDKDQRVLAQLDDELRRRLLIAAGQVSRPGARERKRFTKLMARKRHEEKRVSDEALLNQSGIRQLRKQTVFRTPLPRPSFAALDAPLRNGGDAWSEAEASREPPRVEDARNCYVCKRDFHELHHFYDQLCGDCAELNWRKRQQTADLRGRVVLVTGGRVKIGYQAAILLLRAGAEVIVATRFPRDAARRFGREADSSDWSRRLHVYGVDLRHTPSVELLAHHLLRTQTRLDGLINNACQTVRRPSGWYAQVARAEEGSAGPLEGQILERNRALHSAMLSQVPMLAEDLVHGEHLFPQGQLDQDLQQVDLRESNSWRMALADVPTAELLEVHLVNAVAPFVLNARLRPLLAAVPARDAHVVNVSAMEGQFYRQWKTDKHPHTNMAKAALNMMTRTSAADYVRDGIHMNSVDTGWVTDEDPQHHAERKTRIHGFHPPLDIVDGAARIVDPLLDGVNTGNHVWGMFLKDYKPAPW